MDKKSVKAAWIDARHPMINRRLWGLTLLERNIRELHLLGITQATILTSDDLDPLEHFCHSLPESLAISVTVNDANPFEALISQMEMNDAVLVIEGHALNDRRVLKELMASGSDCTVVSPSGSNPATAAIFTEKNISLFMDQTENLSSILIAANARKEIEKLNLETFNPYIISLRRDIPPFLLRIENKHELNEADDLLRQTVQKGVLDFVGKYIHPPLEFALTKPIAHTPVSPNMVTYFWLMLDGLVVWLFATGHLLTGCILAAISGILDGVDGKLARLTLRFSAFGDRLDHIGNGVFDAFWYLALGWHFSAGNFHSTAAGFTAILIVAYTVERIVPGLFLKQHKAEIWDYETVDVFIRLIGSRMNNNLWVFALGVMIGLARETFYFIVIWMAATAAWHTFRLIYVSRKQKRDAVLPPLP